MISLSNFAFIYILLADENSSTPVQQTNWETLQGEVIPRVINSKGAPVMGRTLSKPYAVVGQF